MNPSSAGAVEFRGVSKTFGTTRAVHALSLDIAPGEFFSLLGPSGCGKTTTLRLLAGLEDPDGGTILIGGNPVTDLPPYRRDLSMVFQHYALFPHLSVERNVAFGLEQRDQPAAERSARVRVALEQVRLDPAVFAQRMPSELSGGQKQRVALARALAIEPAILLLDEPLGALDLKLRKEMQLELKALNRSLGITFLYVTHDQEEALTLSDRLAVMDGGRIVQLGAPAEVYERPRTAFVAEFIGESNFITGEARAGPDGSWTIVGDGLAFRAPPGAGLREGTPVTVAIRPEWLRLQSEAVTGERNILVGRLRELVYLGETLQAVVDVPQLARPIKVSLRNEGQVERPSFWVPGQEVHVAWAPEDSRVLEPEDGGQA